MRVMKNIAPAICGLSFAGLLASCLGGPSLFDRQSVGSDLLTIETEEIDGIAIGKFVANSTITQKLNAVGSIAGSSLSLPPGSLNVDSEISIEEGASISSSSLAAEIGLAGQSITAGGPSVVISS